MADTNERDEEMGQRFYARNTPFSSVIPMMEELRRQKGPVDVFPGLPHVPRPAQQIKIERMMESCIFKSVLAGVLGKSIILNAFKS